MPAGQPPKYKTAAELNDALGEYFEYIKGAYAMELGEDGEFKKAYTRDPENPTITGLCLFLGFESRQSFYDYGKNKKFSYAVKRARLTIENEYEKALARQSPTGAIFALKNMGWHDKVVNEVTGNDGGAIETNSTLTVNIVSTGLGSAKSEKDIQDAVLAELEIKD